MNWEATQEKQGRSPTMKIPIFQRNVYEQDQRHDQSGRTSHSGTQFNTLNENQQQRLTSQYYQNQQLANETYKSNRAYYSNLQNQVYSGLGGFNTQPNQMNSFYKGGIYQLKDEKNTQGGTQIPNRPNTYGGPDNKRAHTQDPRKKFMERKQKIQQNFFEILKVGQENNFQGRSQFIQEKPIIKFDPYLQQYQKVDGNVENEKDEIYSQYKNYQTKITSNMTIKNNNLKYHLMRKLLQEKNTQEIEFLKDKLQEQQRNRITGRSKKGPNRKTASGTIVTNDRSKSHGTAQRHTEEDFQSEEDAETFHASPHEMRPTSQLSIKKDTQTDLLVGNSQLMDHSQIKITDQPIKIGGGGININIKDQTQNKTGQQILRESMPGTRGFTPMVHFDTYGSNEARVRTAYTTQGRKRLNSQQPSKLSLANQNDNSCVITKYNYYGKPISSQVDFDSMPAKVRKQRLDGLKMAAIQKGCEKVNIRQKREYQLMLQQQKVNQFTSSEDPLGQQYLDMSSSAQISSPQQVLYSQQNTQRFRDLNNSINLQNFQIAAQNLELKRMRVNVNTTQHFNPVGKAQMAMYKRQEEERQEKQKQQEAKRVLSEMKKQLFEYQVPPSLAKIQTKLQKFQENFDFRNSNTTPLNNFHQALVKQIMEDKEVMKKIAADPKTNNLLGQRHSTDESQLQISSKSITPKQTAQDVHYTQNTQISQLKSQTRDEHGVFVRFGEINKQFASLLNAQKFGDTFSVSIQEQQAIENFFYKKFPILKEKGVELKIGKLEDKQEFNIIFLGQETPLSKCCRLTMCLNIKAALGNAKIYCMEKLCQFNPLMQMSLPVDFLIVIFPAYYHKLGYEVDEKLLIGQAQEPIGAYQEELISLDLQKKVMAGNHKHMSLRQVISQGSQRQKKILRDKDEQDSLYMEQKSMEADEVIDILQNNNEGQFRESSEKKGDTLNINYQQIEQITEENQSIT